MKAAGMRGEGEGGAEHAVRRTIAVAPTTAIGRCLSVMRYFYTLPASDCLTPPLTHERGDHQNGALPRGTVQ